VSSPIRVCIVAPSLDILGGQAVVAQRLVAQLRRDPDIELSFVPHNPQLPGLFRYMQRVKYLRTFVTSLVYAVSLLRKLRNQDVIHVFSASYWSFLLAPTPAVIIGKAYRKRVILNYRSGEAADHLARWRRTALPVLRMADSVVVPSQYLVDVFAEFGIAARAISNFVEADKIPFRERTNPKPRFIANRNFAPHYNVSCVLQAFALVQQRVPEAELIVAGDGEQRELLHELARTLGLRNTRFVGQVPPERMAELYDAADVYLNAPNIDNMPNSIIEAFAAGIPVVTTSAGGIRHIVSHDRNGLLASINDHAALAAQAIRVLTEAGLGHRLSQCARQDVLSKYTWSAVHARWRRAYGLPDHPQQCQMVNASRKG